MTRPLVDRVADAVLYEGYILYPYRPSSVKNRQRWTFGGLFPESCSLARDGFEPAALQTECLVEGNGATAVRCRVRFLHLMTRSVGGRPWQEAEDREIRLPKFRLDDTPSAQPFAFPGQSEADDRGGCIQLPVQGIVKWAATVVGDGLFRLTVRVVNLTPTDHPDGDREELLPVALASTHVILESDGGAFVSLTDPPESLRDAAAACQNVGGWPVLVGEPGERNTLLASPIILPDYPQLAPESPGDLFDGTEIDEILTLRILTLTDEEKQEMRAADPRADALLSRTEALGRDELMRLHGVVRELRRLPGEGGRP